MLRRSPVADWHKAIRSGELHPGEVFPVHAGRQAVMVARLSTGKPVAFAGHCPHQDTDLQDATIWDDNVRCPRHQYLYDAVSGVNLQPTNRVRPENLWRLKPGYLPIYPVEERNDGWIWVSSTPKPVPEGWNPALEEPPEGAEADEIRDEAVEDITTEVVKTIQVRLGASFELRLPTNPLPGHVWDVQVAGEFLEIVDQGLLAADPPRWRVQIAALTEGEDEVRCQFTAPWDRDPSEIRRYVVRILPPD